MLHGMEMFGGVFILRRIAAADVSADQAQAQVHPAIAHGDAFGADVRGCGGDFDFVEMGALLGHCFHYGPRRGCDRVASIA